MENLFNIEYMHGDWTVSIEYNVNGGYGGITICIKTNLNQSLSFTEAFEGTVSKDEAFVMAQRMLKELGEDFSDMVKKTISDMKSDLKYQRDFLFGE